MRALTKSKAQIRSSASTLAFYALCLLVPIGIFCALAFWGGIYPFGDHSFLTEDLKYQYIDFYTWFWRVLHGQANLSYSFAQGLGMNTWGLYSYYLASPFNLIIALFSKENLTLAKFIISALKLGCIQVSTAWYLIKRFKLDKPAAFLLALSFTFCSWSVTNIRNPLWMDSLYLLPICAYGVYELIQDGKIIKLSIALSLNVMFCWYMGYIDILFLSLFVFVEFFDYIALNGHSKRFFLSRALRFTAALALSLALAAWTFIPTICAMAKSQSATSIGTLFRTSPRALIRGFLPTMWANDAKTPQFYSGIITMLLAISMLFIKKIPCKTKVATIIITVFIIASSIFCPLEYIWCGMRVPNGFYSRTAFLLSFITIWAAGYACRSHQIHLKITSRKKTLFVAMAAIFVLVDVTINAHACWNQLYIGYSQTEHNQYSAQVDKTISEIKQSDPIELFRIDRTSTRADSAALNEGLAHSYNELSSYTSASNPQAIAILNSLGYSSVGEFSTRYAEPILAVDALLGVKYSLSDVPALDYVSLQSVNTATATTCYQNPYALSLGMPCTADMCNSTLSGDNPFERQNELYSKILGRNVKLYTKIHADETTSRDDNTGTTTSKAWTCTVPEGTIGYVYVNKDRAAGSYWPVQLSIDERVINNEAWRFDNNIRQIAEGDGATMHTVTISVAEGYQSMPENTDAVFYALNLEEFKGVIAELKSKEFNPSVFTDGFVSGKYHATKNGYLLLSIPYDRGWTVTVNGKKTNMHPAADKGLSCIPVGKGQNNIELSYHTPGALAGAIISAATMTGILIYSGICRIRSRRGSNPEGIVSCGQVQ